MNGNDERRIPVKILKNAVAGTLESSDLFIQIEPDEKELTLEIDSVVANQYMDSIRLQPLHTPGMHLCPTFHHQGLHHNQ